MHVINLPQGSTPGTTWEICQSPNPGDCLETLLYEFHNPPERRWGWPLGQTDDMCIILQFAFLRIELTRKFQITWEITSRGLHACPQVK